jgi:KH domain-containing protein
METVYLKKIGEVRKLKPELEKKLNVAITISKGRVTMKGSSLDEYDALKVFEAIGFGFGVRKALKLKEEDSVFKIVHIKEHTKRNLTDIKSRLIGTHGKTRKTISVISGCEVVIGESDVGIIGYVEDVERAETAVISLIKGSKQANTYRYLERMNRAKKEGQPDF